MPSKCSPFALQKDSFYTPKGPLLQAKRSPFCFYCYLYRPQMGQKGYIQGILPASYQVSLRCFML